MISFIIKYNSAIEILFRNGLLTPKCKILFITALLVVFFTTIIVPIVVSTNSTNESPSTSKITNNPGTLKSEDFQSLKERSTIYVSLFYSSAYYHRDSFGHDFMSKYAKFFSWNLIDSIWFIDSTTFHIEPSSELFCRLNACLFIPI